MLSLIDLFLDRNIQILKLTVIERFLYTLLCLFGFLLYLSQSTHLLRVFTVLFLRNHLGLLLGWITATRVQGVHFNLISCITLSNVELIFWFFLTIRCILFIRKQISIYFSDMLTIFTPSFSFQQSFKRSFFNQALLDWIVVMRNVKILLIYLQDYTITFVYSVELVKKTVIFVRVLEFIIWFYVLNFVRHQSFP